MFKNLVRLATLVALSTCATAVASHAIAPKLLEQNSSGTALPAGSMIPSGASVELTATSDSLTCNNATPTYNLEFEVVPVGQAFTGTVTHSSPLMAKPTCADVVYPSTTVTVSNGQWKWRTREKSGTQVSSWVDFNGGLVAFEVAPPNVPDIIVDNVAITNVVSDNTKLEFNVAATFRNRGTAGTGNFVWKAYLSTNKTLEMTDQLVHTATTAISVAGESTTTDTSPLITLQPPPPPGAYYVLVEADPAPGTVSEFDENNNVGSMPNYFVKGFDMVASSITNGPANAGPGNSVTLTVNFFNQGVEAPANPIEFRIVATRDQNVSADDFEVHRQSVTVGGAQNFSLPVTFTLPAGVAGGDVWFGLELDPAKNGVANPNVEALENNNTTVSVGQTHIQQADLQANSADLVDVLTGTSTRKGDLGQPVRFKAEAQNIGDFAAGPYRVGLVLSKDTTLSLLVDQVFGDVEVQGLAAPVGTTPSKANLDVTATLPTKDKNGAPLTTGDYYLFVMLDSYNAINEINESNNTIAVVGPVRLRTSAADYATTHVQVPSSAAAGEAIPLTRTFRNLGTDAGPEATYRCYASVNDIIAEQDFPLAFTNDDGTTDLTRSLQLASGAANQATEWVRLPGSMPQGKYYFGCIIDPEGQIPELEENNNAKATSFTVNVTPQSFQIATQQMPDAVVGVPYSFQLSTVGHTGAVTWKIAEGSMGPENIALAQNGTLAGTPTAIGATSFKVEAQSGDRTAEAVLVARVLPPTAQLTITTDNLPPVVNSTSVAYQGTFSASGGAQPYTWRILSGALPNGIVLDAQSGLLSGLPKPGIPNDERQLVVQVQDALGGIASKPLKLRVMSSGALAVRTLALPNALVGQEYLADLSAIVIGGGPLAVPLKWSVVAGRLPDGLALNTHTDGATGLVTGKPLVSETYALTVQVEDANGRADAIDFVVRIHASAIKVTLEAPAPATLHRGDALDLKLVSTGAGGATFTFHSGALPKGISVTEDGRINGTVADEDGVEGTYTFTVEAKDAAGGKGLGSFSLEVTRRPEAAGCSSTGTGTSFWVLVAAAALFLVIGRKQPTRVRVAAKSKR